MKTSSPKTELRIYSPPLGSCVAAAFRPFVGKIVTVRWAAPVFIEAEPDHHGNPRWLTKWFGYVAEMDRQIPGEELHPLLLPPEMDHAQ